MTARLAAGGHAVALVEQPYRVAGRRAPVTAAARLDEAFRAAVAMARAGVGEVPLVVGGRSAGARVACRTATALGAAGAVALAFPLHPPGRPDRSRVEELRGAGVPLLVVQGERDPFGRPAEFPEPLPAGTTLVPVAGDHTLAADLDAVAGAVARFVDALGQTDRPA